MSNDNGLEQTTRNWLLSTVSHLAIATVGVPVEARDKFTKELLVNAKKGVLK